MRWSVINSIQQLWFFVVLACVSTVRALLSNKKILFTFFCSEFSVDLQECISQRCWPLSICRLLSLNRDQFTYGLLARPTFSEENRKKIIERKRERKDQKTEKVNICVHFSFLFELFLFWWRSTYISFLCPLNETATVAQKESACVQTTASNCVIYWKILGRKWIETNAKRLVQLFGRETMSATHEFSFFIRFVERIE